MKSNEPIRMSGDFSVTIKSFVIKDPLPRYDDLAAKQSGHKYFVKIDLRDAYLQLEIDL